MTRSHVVFVGWICLEFLQEDEKNIKINFRLCATPKKHKNDEREQKLFSTLLRILLKVGTAADIVSHQNEIQRIITDDMLQCFHFQISCLRELHQHEIVSSSSCELRKVSDSGNYLSFIFSVLRDLLVDNSVDASQPAKVNLTCSCIHCELRS